MQNDRRKVWDWKLTIQLAALFVMVAGGLIMYERRITTVETQMNEQFKGYIRVVGAINNRLASIEEKVDCLVDVRFC